MKAQSAEPIRLQMIDDLLERYKSIGLRRSEIISLLATAALTDYFRKYDFVYWLGPKRGLFSIDLEWLAFKFDA